MRKLEWQDFSKEMLELEVLENKFDSFIPTEINSKLVQRVNTSNCSIASSEKPILSTDGMYTCTGILAYDLSKKYAFLAHSYGNEAYGIDNSTTPSQIYNHDFYVPRGIMYGSSVHVIEMLESLSKRELYKLKIAIVIGSRPNMNLVDSMINTIIYSRTRRMSVESIVLIKPFIAGIHLENDINYGRVANIFDLRIANSENDLDIVRNSITGEVHSYDKNRGSSFAFDVRDGHMFTYNSDTGQYYTYDQHHGIEIKIR